MKKLLISCLLAGMSSTTVAAVVQYDVTGTVTNDFNSQINLSESYTLSFLVDTDALGTAINDYTSYDILSGTIQFSGGYSGSFGGGELRVNDNATIGLNPGADILYLFVGTAYDVSGMPTNTGSVFNNLQMELRDSSGTALTSEAIPGSLQSSDWDASDGNILWNNPTMRFNDLVASGVSVGAPVPVPAAVWLFGSALAGLGWLRRKQTA